MAVTPIQLAAELRIGDGETLPDDPIGSILTRLLAVAMTLVDRYAPGAGQAIQDQAIIQVAAYLYDTDPSGGNRAIVRNAITQSGAASLLDTYRGPRAVAMPPPPSQASESGMTGGEPAGDAIDQVARDEAAEAKTLAVTAQGEAEAAATAAGQARTVADSAASAVADAGAAAILARQEAAAAEAKADENAAAIVTETTRAKAAETRLETNLGTEINSRTAGHEQIIRDYKAADTGLGNRITAVDGRVTGVSDEVDALAPRVPTADPPAQAAWQTNAAGVPGWRGSKRTIAVSSDFTSGFRPVPEIAARPLWQWEGVWVSGTKEYRIYPYSGDGLHEGIAARATYLVPYLRLHFGEGSLEFAPRGGSASVTLEYADIWTGTDRNGYLYWSFDSPQVDFASTDTPGTAGELPLDYRVTWTVDATDVETIAFDGDHVTIDSDGKGEPRATVTPRLALEAQADAMAAQIEAEAALAAAQAAMAHSAEVKAIADRLSALVEAADGIDARTPTDTPPPLSMWATDGASVPSWMPTPVEGVDVSGRDPGGEVYGPWEVPGRQINLGAFWLWELRGQAVGDEIHLALTPYLGSSHLSGDNDRQDLSRWAAAVFPSDRTRIRPAEHDDPGDDIPEYQVTRALVRAAQGRLYVDIRATPVGTAPLSWSAEANAGTARTDLPLSVSHVAEDVERAVVLVFDDADVRGDDEGHAHIQWRATQINADLAVLDRRVSNNDDDIDQLQTDLETAERTSGIADAALGRRIDGEATERGDADDALDGRLDVIEGTTPAIGEAQVWGNAVAGGAPTFESPTIEVVPLDYGDWQDLPPFIVDNGVIPAFGEGTWLVSAIFSPPRREFHHLHLQPGFEQGTVDDSAKAAAITAAWPGFVEQHFGELGLPVWVGGRDGTGAVLRTFESTTQGDSAILPALVSVETVTSRPDWERTDFRAPEHIDFQFRRPVSQQAQRPARLYLPHAETGHGDPANGGSVFLTDEPVTNRLHVIEQALGTPDGDTRVHPRGNQVWSQYGQRSEAGNNTPGWNKVQIPIRQVNAGPARLVPAPNNSDGFTVAVNSWNASQLDDRLFIWNSAWRIGRPLSGEAADLADWLGGTDGNCWYQRRAGDYWRLSRVETGQYSLSPTEIYQTILLQGVPVNFLGGDLRNQGPAGLAMRFISRNIEASLRWIHSIQIENPADGDLRYVDRDDTGYTLILRQNALP